VHTRLALDLAEQVDLPIEILAHGRFHFAVAV
jgi:hypothetical protein